MFEVLLRRKAKRRAEDAVGSQRGRRLRGGQARSQRRAKCSSMAGRKGEAIEGLVPYTIEIRSAETGVLCHGITTEPDDEPVGAWLKGPNEPLT